MGQESSCWFCCSCFQSFFNCLGFQVKMSFQQKFPTNELIWEITNWSRGSKSFPCPLILYQHKTNPTFQRLETKWRKSLLSSLSTPISDDQYVCLCLVYIFVLRTKFHSLIKETFAEHLLCAAHTLEVLEWTKQTWFLPEEPSDERRGAGGVGGWLVLCGWTTYECRERGRDRGHYHMSFMCWI